MFSVATNFKELKEFIELNTRYNNKITSFFGIPSDLGLDGGREFFSNTPKISTEEVIKFVEECNNHKIGFYFTLNTIIKPSSNDKKLNKMLSETHNNLNAVICATDSMRDFIKTSYPKFKLIASRIFNKTTVEGINDLCNKFDLVVLPEELNHNLNLINSLKHINKIELIVNSFCHHSCKKRMLHYNLNSEFNQRLNNGEDPHKLAMEFIKKLGSCTAKSIKDVEKVRIEPEQINSYIELGIKQFKVLDRRDPPTALLVEEYLRKIK